MYMIYITLGLLVSLTAGADNPHIKHLFLKPVFKSNSKKIELIRPVLSHLALLLLLVSFFMLLSTLRIPTNKGALLTMIFESVVYLSTATLAIYYSQEHVFHLLNIRRHTEEANEGFKQIIRNVVLRVDMWVSSRVSAVIIVVLLLNLADFFFSLF